MWFRSLSTPLEEQRGRDFAGVDEILESNGLASCAAWMDARNSAKLQSKQGIYKIEY